MAGVFLLVSEKMAQVNEAIPMAEKPFSQLKGDERLWRIEDAVRTLKRYAELKRKENSALIKAAREELQKEIDDSKKFLATTS